MPDTRPMPPAPNAAQMVQSNMLSLYRALSAWQGIVLHDEPDLFWVESEIGFPLFNGVRRSLLAGDTADRRVQQLVSRFREKQLFLSWYVWPDDQPADLPSRLQAAGLTLVERTPGMIARLDNAPAPAAPPGVDVSRVERSEELPELLEPLAACFGLSGRVSAAFLEVFSQPELQRFTHYIARIDGKPVGAATLFCDGDSAGIFNVACLPEVRGRGIGSGLTALAMHVAAAAGCVWALLTSSEEGYRVYQRLGFEECCAVDIYMPAPAAA